MKTIFKLILLGIVVLVVLTGFRVKKLRDGHHDGTMWAAEHHQKECFEEGLRLMNRSDSQFNRSYVTGFATGCMDNAKKHPGLCRILPRMGKDIEASNMKRCETMGLETGPCVDMLKVYGRYCP